MGFEAAGLALVLVMWVWAARHARALNRPPALCRAPPKFSEHDPAGEDCGPGLPSSEKAAWPGPLQAPDPSATQRARAELDLGLGHPGLSGPSLGVPGDSQPQRRKGLPRPGGME